ncbi:hypothetical protein BO94DRAFT_589175 [Aspergillus sclerotioniger CBS 115572]|uniref:Serine protease n=1 Tax=Aspergillus sclerotioniger CBS 115572 TaxID=1450535 RepID=A0A317VJI9_9EURO|nr:hypothetical protein BO94DRAFT_589175 [Aspergillus sclerotioniger CBS 115572]PWY74493.1 hypothetical protein BO94DRAFT_589175 [Aspergillus sclerotioniger CBS 115572]
MSDEESFELNPLVWDPSRSRLPEKEESWGLKKARTQDREDWVVRLKFKQDGEPDEKVGTGFFLNIPGAEWYVILTAGHNLVDKSGHPSKDLIIERHKHKYPIEPLDIPPFVCPLYHRERGEQGPDHDYGVILVRRQFETNKNLRKALDLDLGFGFALNLAYENLESKTLELTGFFPHEEDKTGRKVQSKEQELEPLSTSSGECRIARESHLEYDITTDKGLSGSPVFMPYNGHETVVAVHNNGPARRGKGSTGARINATVLKQIFEWANLSQHHKALKAASDKSEPDPLYLHFPPYEDLAWVHWGKEGMNTAFDVFPAYAPTPLVDVSMLHVFQHVPPPDWPEARKDQQWVLWDVMAKGVTLTDTLQQFCFVELKQSKKGKMFTVVVRLEGGRDQSMACLVVNGDDITELDRETDTFDGSNVSLEKYIKNLPLKYNTFCWDDVAA